MIRIHEQPEAGLTGLELLILALLLAGVIAGVVILTSESSGIPWNRLFPGGLVAESMYMSGDGIQPAGSVTGFSAEPGGQLHLPVIYRHPDPGRLGAVQLMVSLFIGDTGAIDMDHLNVTWITQGSFEQIPRTDEPALRCPNWTISGKYNLLPGRTADSDDWLEPGEQFQILLCPSENLVPYQGFTLGMHPDGVAYPLRITRSVPPRVSPVMILT